MMRRQDGSATVEFALSLILLLTFVLGIVDLSRMLFTWNAANEAARAGARYAVVCADTTTAKSVTLSRMQAMLPQIADIDLAWQPAGCTSATCQGVKLTITSLNYQWISPIAGRATRLPGVAMPDFSTYLSRELMRQGPHSDAVCM